MLSKAKMVNIKTGKLTKKASPKIEKKLKDILPKNAKFYNKRPLKRKLLTQNVDSKKKS